MGEDVVHIEKLDLVHVYEKDVEQVKVETDYPGYKPELIAHDYVRNKTEYNFYNICRSRLPSSVPDETLETLRENFHGDPVIPGIPDLLGYKEGSPEDIMMIEVKRCNDGLRPSQIKWMVKSKNIPYKVLIVPREIE